MLWQIKKLTIAIKSKKETWAVLQANKDLLVASLDKANKEQEAVPIAEAAQVRVLAVMLVHNKADKANKADAATKKAKNLMFPIVEARATWAQRENLRVDPVEEVT